MGIYATYMPDETEIYSPATVSFRAPCMPKTLLIINYKLLIMVSFRALCMPKTLQKGHKQHYFLAILR